MSNSGMDPPECFIKPHMSKLKLCKYKTQKQNIKYMYCMSDISLFFHTYIHSSFNYYFVQQIASPFFYSKNICLMSLEFWYFCPLLIMGSLCKKTTTQASFTEDIFPCHRKTEVWIIKLTGLARFHLSASVWGSWCFASYITVRLSWPTGVIE